MTSSTGRSSPSAAPTPPAQAVERPAGPGAFPGLLALSVIARLPYGMGAIGLLSTGVARHYRPDQTSGLAAAFTVGLAFATPVWGRLADRHGFRPVLRSCTALNLIGTAAAAALSDYKLVVLGSLLIGCGTPPLAAAMRSTWNRLLDAGPARARAANLESVLADLVHIAGRLLVAVLDVLGPGLILPVQAAFLLVSGLPLSFDSRLHSPKPAPGTSTLGNTLLRGRLLFSIVLAMAISHGCAATAIVLGAPGGHGWNGALLLALWGVGSAVGGSLLLRWKKGRPTAHLVVIGLVTFVVMCSAAPLAFSMGLGGAAVAVLGLGLPLAPTFTGLYLLAAELAPENRQTETFALMSSLIVLGFGIGTSITGEVDQMLSTSTGGFGAAAIACGVAAVIAGFGERNARTATATAG